MASHGDRQNYKRDLGCLSLRSDWLGGGCTRVLHGRSPLGVFPAIGGAGTHCQAAMSVLTSSLID